MKKPTLQQYSDLDELNECNARVLL